FTFRVTEPSLCASRMFIYSSDRDTYSILDAETQLPPNVLLSPESQLDASGILETLPTFHTLVAYSGESVGAEECAAGKSRIGGEGFSFVIQNSENTTAALGCAGVGVGHTRNPALDCNAHIESAVVIEFSTSYNVTKVSN